MSILEDEMDIMKLIYVDGMVAITLVLPTLLVVMSLITGKAGRRT